MVKLKYYFLTSIIAISLIGCNKDTNQDTSATAGISLDEAIDNGVYAKDGTGIIRGINYALFNDGKSTLPLYLRIDNLGAANAEYKIKVECGAILDTYEATVEIKGTTSSKEGVQFKYIKVPIRPDAPFGEYKIKATLSSISHPDSEDQIKEVDAMVYKPDQDELRQLDIELNSVTADAIDTLPDFALEDFRKYIKEHLDK